MRPEKHAASKGRDAKKKLPILASRPSQHAQLNHERHIPRIRRVTGQLLGIEEMIRNGRYCTEIITQLRAAAAAISAVESEIFRTHLRGCVRSTMSTGMP